MKLHLPLSLRSSLLALFTAVVACHTVQAASMGSAATLVTYTDFGQNCGRYIAGDGGNALLQYIRQQEGGIAITYTDGRADYVISNEQGMIDFSAGYNRSIATAISPTITVTVGHNGEQSSSFTSEVYGIGGSHCINYKSVSIAGSSVFSNAYNDGRYVDYRISRQSKIFTDITPVEACSSTQEARDLVSGTNMFYHSGAGYHQYPGLNLPYQAYVYETGGIIDPLSLNDTSAGGLRVGTTFNGVNATNPLPYAALAGDSGSPVYVYDAEEGVYKFWGCTALSDGTNCTYLSYTNKYQEALNAFNKSVDMSSVSAVDGRNTVYLNAVNEVVGTQSDGSNSTTLYAGKIKDAEGNVLTTHIGLQNGLSTWGDLSGVKNNQNWYNYGNGYVAQNNADLYFTENLLFSSSAAQNAVVLNATVDLGVGYAEFSAAGDAPVSYTVSSASGGNYMLNSAGYLVNENVSLHLQLTSSDTHMYEWRKIGAGDMYIEGSGDNNILLNLGGSGSTYLKRTGGYAAYNVLVNNGARVVIDDIGQIERDFTFGNKGGVLDMNGQSMDWYTTSTSESIADAGFTINALTEDAVIANNSGNSTLVYRQSGETTFLGSFQDTKDSSLKIQYAGGGTWVLNSVHTNLQNDNSGLQVDNGKVVLRGTNTIHAAGSANGVNANRYTNANDWHYADAAMDVTVKNGATFELGSHARLTGDVTVESGGIYVMREGVTHAQEYVEGGQRLEDVSKYAAYYGHKGDTVLNGGTLQVEYSAGVTAHNTYAGNISGTGNMSVDLKDCSLTFSLAGDNTFTGTKTLVCGGLIAESATALGDTSTNKWVIQEDAWIASHKETGAQLLEHIDTSSTGTLVLSSDSEQLNIAGYNNLFIGAETGKTVQYGTLGTTETLNAADGAWRLGGGGGTLVVNYVLSGDNNLLLGATENSTGVVHLTNQGNSFTGNIIFSGEGVLLTYEDGALGSAIVDLSYGNASDLYSASDVMRMSTGSDGMVLVDNFSDNAIALQNHPSLTVGVAADKTWSGELWLAENQAYRFGTINGATFTVTTALESGRDLIIDAQGSSGGKVVLDSSAITGQISVMGRNDGTGGDITLVISQDDALSAASKVSVQNGGILDLGGTSHVLHNVEVQSGGRINGTSASDLVFNITENSTVAGRLQLGTVEKTGAADLSISADAGSSWSLLTISEGSVTVGSGSLGSNIALAGGVLAAGSGAAVNYSGTISIAEGATECIRGGAWKLTGAENIVNNGTLNLQNSKLYFNSTSAQTLRGTLNAVGSSELHSIESNGADYMQKQLEHIHVASGNELKIVDHTWNSIWHIDKLTGDGTFKWNPQNTHYYSSSVIIDGDGGFSGTLEFYRQHDPGYADTAATYSKNFQAYLQIDSEEAISRATVNLVGTWASYANRDAYATLALNDDRIKIGGLNATGHALAHVMAGAAPNGVSRSAPDSTRSTTLEITGSGNYEYKGTIGTEGDKTGSYGVSIEMTGTGTQQFNGSTVVVNDVSALNGTLNFKSSGLYIKGDVTVAQGATLKLNDSFTLGTGHTLNVVAGANGGAAVLNSGLVFDGGTLRFDVLSSSSAVLAVNGSISASDAGGMNLTFADTDALQLGVKYQLASGDWSAMQDRISLFTPELYKQTTLETGSSGLSIQLDMKEGFAYWGGNHSEVQPGSKLVFMGGAGNLGRLEITGGAQADTAVFDNATDFTISTTDGSAVAFGTMGKYDSGALVVNTNVTADTLLVEDTSALRGTDKLAVGEISGTGTLQVAGGSHLQVESGEGATLQLLDGSKLTTTGTELGSNLVLGEDAVSNRVNLDIQGESLSLNGAVSVQGDTTMAVQGSGVLNYNAGMNDLAELQLSETTGLNVATTLTTKVAQNGATVTVQNGGVWQVAADRSTLDGKVVVNAGGVLQGGDIIKSGKDVELYGTLDYNSFVVQDGATLNLREGGRLDADNAVTIAGTGIMRLNRQTLQDKVELKDGATMYGNGGTIASGAEVIATSGTATLSAGDGTLAVNGHIGATAGATLRLEGNRADIYINAINTKGGTLELACSTVNLGHLATYATQNIGGTLSIAGNVTVNGNQTDFTRYSTITHNINHLDITTGSKLTLKDPNNSWNHIYNISALTGSGEIHWQSDIYWYAQGTSRMVLSGDNSFSGTLLVEQVNNDGSTQHVSLAHNYAARNMVINLWGDSNSRPGLAISTQNAHVAGIGGTTNTFLYSGAVKTAANGDNPTSSALNTLTINTAGKNHTYNGTILGDASNGLNIVKDGAGKQTFTNSANVVHDVTTLQGSLEFTAAPTVYGDISIAQGAELTLGSGAYSLETGHSLNVLAGVDGMPAVLNNSLVLNGGALSFSAFDAEQASLSTGGVSFGSGINSFELTFSNLKTVEQGTSYLLVGGDWSAFDDFNVTLKDCRYYQANLNASAEGLMVSFSLSDNSVYWEGSSTSLSPDSIVIFSDKNGIHSAELPGGTSVSSGVFEHEADYTLSSSSGSAVVFGEMEKYGAGSLIVDAAVSAGALQVMDDCTITGSGSLRADSLALHADLTTEIALDVSSVSDDGKYSWTINGSERKFTQSLTREQLASLSNVCVKGEAVLDISTTSTPSTAETFSVSNISGDGTLALSLGTSYDNKLAVSEAFAGTTHVKSGNFTINGSTFGDTLKLANGVNFQLTGGSTVQLDKNLVLEGATQVHQNSNANLTITGDVSGDGTWVRKGGGKLNFNGTVNLGAYTQDSTETNFNATASLGSLTMSGGTVNIGENATTTIRNSLSVTGGQFNIKNNATLHLDKGATGSVNALNVSGGKVNIGEGATLNITTEQTAGSVDFSYVSGLGTLGVKLGADYGQTFSLSPDFAGTTHVQTGNFTINGSTFGNTLKLANGVNFQLNHDTTVVLNQNLELEGTSQVHQNTSSRGANLTINGSVSGANGVYQRKGGGTLTFNGAVTLKSFNQDANATTIFNAASTVESLSVTSGTVKIGDNGRLDITTAVTSGNYTVSNITGTGTLGVKLGTDYTRNQKLAISTGFTGTTYVMGGNFTINDSTFGNTLKLANGVNFQLTGGSTVLLDKDLVLEGTSQVHQNSDATLTIAGSVSGDGTYERRGGGVLTINGTVALGGGMLHTESGGTTRLKGNSSLGALTLTKGKVEVYRDVEVNTLNMSSSGTLQVKEQGVIKLGNATNGAQIQISKAEAELKAASSSSSSYAVSSTSYEIKNADVKVLSSDSVNLANKVTQSSVSNIGSGMLTVSNAANTLSGVVASGGDMTVLNQAALSLDVLEVATGKSVGMYTGGNTSSAKAAVAVSSSAVFGAGAALTTASLTLADGATLEMTSIADAVKLNGAALTFGSGVQLGDNLLAAVQALEYGDTLALFTGVGEFTLHSAAATELESTRVLASSVFSNVQNSSLYVDFQVVDNVGSLLVVNVPEPATTTLSLLALTALAMRRRRK